MTHVAAPLPPGPDDEVDLGIIREAPLAFLCALHARFGDVVRHRSGETTVTLVNRPDLARRVLNDRTSTYTKTGTPDERMLVPLLGRGLLTSEGEQWRRQRRLAQPAFAHRQVVRFDGLMVAAAEDLAARWSQAAGTGRVVRVDHDLTSLTLVVVARSLLGADLSIGNRFAEAVDAVNAFMSHHDPSGSGSVGDVAAFRQAVGFFDMIVGLLIQAGRAEGEDAEHLLGALLRARSENLADGFTTRELRDQVLTLLMAGHETTAKALTWTLWLLDRHPDVRRRLEEEVDTVLDGRSPTADDLESLAFCRKVLLESMRLYPPVWLLSRMATEDDELGGFFVPAGSLVCISPYLLHRRPADWPRPEEFGPDRFDRVEDSATSFAYLPFGGGPRQCIGRSFALVEAQLVLATLVTRFRLTLQPGHVVAPEALVTLRPRDGLLMTVQARR